MTKLIVEPDAEDFELITVQYGKAATEEQRAHHYRLAQGRKIARLYEMGIVPLEMKRELDAIVGA